MAILKNWFLLYAIWVVGHSHMRFSIRLSHFSFQSLHFRLKTFCVPNWVDVCVNVNKCKSGNFYLNSLGFCLYSQSFCIVAGKCANAILFECIWNNIRASFSIVKRKCFRDEESINEQKSTWDEWMNVIYLFAIQTHKNVAFYVVTFDTMRLHICNRIYAMIFESH